MLCEFGLDGWCALCSPSSTFVLDGLFSSLPHDYGCGRCFSFSTLCVTPTLFVLFASVFALLSARCRYPSIRFSVSIRFFRCSVLLIPCLITLSLLRRASGSLVPPPPSTYTETFPFSPFPMSCSLSTLPSRPRSQSRCVYCTYVFSFEV